VKEIKRVGLLYDGKKPGASFLAHEIERWFAEREIQSIVRNVSGSEDLLTLDPDIDLIITFGGDGLILHVANIIASSNLSIPVIRVNFGTRGFLTNVEPDDVFQHLEDLMSGNCIITKRSRIEISVSESESPILKGDALNEITLERIGTKAVPFSLSIGSKNAYAKEKLLERRGDGIIFSTRTGSTAYNMSAGGPILTDDQKFVATVVCPTDREESFFFVEPADSTVFKITVNDRLSRKNVRAVADGKVVAELSYGVTATIQKSPISTLFVEFGDP
jgi:NAD+ kinase